MEILNPSKYDEFEQFAKNHKNSYFMQSIAWSELKSNWGREIIVSRRENGEIRGGALVLIKRLPGGFSLMYCPRGPVYDYHDKDTISDIIKGIRILGKKYKAFSFKMDPCIWETDDEAKKILKNLGFSHRENAQENETLQRRYNYGLLDIEGRTPEAEIASFNQKTRYNIRLSKRKGVTCEIHGKEGLDDWMMLSEITAKRDNFVLRPRSYYEKMLDVFGDDLRLYICYYENTPVSAAMCCRYGGKCYYIFGASSNEHRNVMPNYLMQWEMIQWALEGGCFCYDFLGIPVNVEENSPTYGVYKFKRGFEGTVLPFAGEFDLTLNPAIDTLFNTAMGGKRIIDGIKTRIREKKA